MIGTALILAWLLFAVLVRPYSQPWSIQLAGLTVLLLGLAGFALEHVARKAWSLLDEASRGRKS